MRIENYIPTGQYRYYYNVLSDGDKKAYDEMLCGLLSFSTSIRCNCHHSHAHELYYYIRYDIPELFYVKTVKVRYSTINKNSCTLLPEYRFDKEISCQVLDTIEQKYKSFILKTLNLNDEEKEKAIHDLLVRLVKYKDVDAPYSHEAPGALLYNIGVCEGMAKAFKFLSDRVGLKSLVVVGTSNAHGNPNGHAWNIVWLDQACYHIDVTFDSTISDGCPRYDYFNLSDEEIGTNHQWDCQIPACMNSYAFYRKQGLLFDKKSDLIKFLRTSSRTERTIVFQIPKFNYPTDEIVNMISNLIQTNIYCTFMQQRRYTLSYNHNRMVFQVNIL